MSSMDAVHVGAGFGLEDDRYSRGAGHYSKNRRVGRHLTLIEAETIEALWREERIVLNPGESRRNLTTRDVRLNDLVGQRFWVGNVLCVGTGLCEPCQYLSDLTGKPLLRFLVHRGGLRADVLTSGQIRVGDLLRVEPDATVEPALGVGVIAVHDRKVLVGRRISSAGLGAWSVPDGSPLPGESLEACAVREMREETGLEVTKPRFLGHTIDVLSEFERTYRTTFFAVEPHSNNPIARESDIWGGWRWIGWNELPQPLFRPLASFRETTDDPTAQEAHEGGSEH